LTSLTSDYMQQYVLCQRGPLKIFIRYDKWRFSANKTNHRADYNVTAF